MMANFFAVVFSVLSCSVLLWKVEWSGGNVSEDREVESFGRSIIRLVWGVA